MPGWDELLRRLAEAPRENGSAGLAHAAEFLRDALERSGVAAELVAFTAHPYALRLAGVLILAGGLLYFRLMRSRRHGAALAVALLWPAALLAQLDYQVPVFAWIGAVPQHHVRARLEVDDPERRLILAAHYDTKTDLLDHVERAPVDLLAVVVPPLMLLGALGGWLAEARPPRRRWPAWLARGAAWTALLYGAAAFVALSAGAFAPRRSPGALDDGASCALLVRLAGALAATPPGGRTEIEILLLSAEEVGTQGSWEYAAGRFGSGVPTFVVNLEGLGASARHAVLSRERFTLRSYLPDPGLFAWLDAVHREHFGAPLERTPFGGATDARSFLSHGVPAITLVSRDPESWVARGLHSSDDSRSRVDEEALDASLAFLLDAVRTFDSRDF